MSSIISILALDEATIIKFFWLFKIGFVHPTDAPGLVKGLIIGFWRFEIQLILGFWNRAIDIVDKEANHA